MFDMSWGEVMVIGAVALIVIGPKDLPKALRTVGNMVSKTRRMASEFQGQFNEAMREAELDDVKRQIQGINESVGSMNTGFNPLQTIRDELKGTIDQKPGIYDYPTGGTPAVTPDPPPADFSVPSVEEPLPLIAEERRPEPAAPDQPAPQGEKTA